MLFKRKIKDKSIGQIVDSLIDSTKEIEIWFSRGYEDGEWVLGIRSDNNPIIDNNCYLIGGELIRNCSLSQIKNHNCSVGLNAQVMVHGVIITIFLGQYSLVKDTFHKVDDRVYCTAKRLFK